MYCLQACMCPFQPGTNRGESNEGLKDSAKKSDDCCPHLRRVGLIVTSQQKLNVHFPLVGSRPPFPDTSAEAPHCR